MEAKKEKLNEKESKKELTHEPFFHLPFSNKNKDVKSDDSLTHSKKTPTLAQKDYVTSSNESNTYLVVPRIYDELKTDTTNNESTEPSNKKKFSLRPIFLSLAIIFFIASLLFIPSFGIIPAFMALFFLIIIIAMLRSIHLENKDKEPIVKEKRKPSEKKVPKNSLLLITTLLAILSFIAYAGLEGEGLIYLLLFGFAPSLLVLSITGILLYDNGRTFLFGLFALFSMVTIVFAIIVAILSIAYLPGVFLTVLATVMASLLLAYLSILYARKLRH